MVQQNSKPKALIILTPGFPANLNDSTCVPPQQLFVKALKEASPDLNIIVLTFTYPFFSRDYFWNGIRVISFGNSKNNRLLRSFTGIRVWRVLKELNNDHQIIGLLSFWLGNCALTGSRFAHKYHLKHYCWLLGQDAKPGNKYFHKIKPKGEELIALSDFIVREFNKNYGVVPAHIIPVGIDTDLFGPVNNKRDIDIIGVGSLIPLKQYGVFIEVINKLKDQFPAIKAVICGDGIELQLLQAMIKNMGLEENIVSTGKLAHTEVLAMMQRSKILLHPSNYEGFGAVCLEALYACADVVSFVQPMDKAIPNWHVAKDKEDMVQLLATILADPNREYQPVLPYTIQDNAKSALKLFE